MADNLRDSVAGVKLTPSHVLAQIERIDALVIHGRNQMLEYGDNPWPPLGSIVMTGTLVCLGAAYEAMEVLCEMDSRYCKVRKNHANTLDLWKEARHDVAHFIDRIFRERKGRSPIGGPVDTVQIAIASMRPANDIVIRTGSLDAIWMNSAIAEMEKIINDIRALTV